VLLDLLVAQVQLHQGSPNPHTCLEVTVLGQKWDAGQLALEVLCVTLTVLWVMEKSVDIVEDVALGNARPVHRPSLPEHPVGDIVLPMAAILRIGVQREALRLLERQVVTGNGIRCETSEPLAITHSCDTHHHVLSLTRRRWKKR